MPCWGSQQNQPLGVAGSGVWKFKYCLYLLGSSQGGMSHKRTMSIQAALSRAQAFCWRLNKKDSKKWTDRIMQHKMLAASWLLLHLLYPCHGGWIMIFTPSTHIRVLCPQSQVPENPIQIQALPLWNRVTLLGLLNREGLKSLHNLINYAKFDDVVMLVLRTLVGPSQPWHCRCLQRGISETEMEKYICWFKWCCSDAVEGLL